MFTYHPRTNVIATITQVAVRSPGLLQAVKHANVNTRFCGLVKVLSLAVIFLIQNVSTQMDQGKLVSLDKVIVMDTKEDH
jgi:hypothetical protein